MATHVIQPQVPPNGPARLSKPETHFLPRMATSLRAQRRGGNDGTEGCTAPANRRLCMKVPNSAFNNSERGCTSATAQLDQSQTGTCKLLARHPMSLGDEPLQEMDAIGAVCLPTRYTCVQVGGSN